MKSERRKGKNELVIQRGMKKEIVIRDEDWLGWSRDGRKEAEVCNRRKEKRGMN